MKKKTFSILFAAIFVLMFSIPAFAEQRDIHVFDADGILDPMDVGILENAAAQISDHYDCGVYIALFNNMANYGYYNIEEFGESVYREWSLGYGDGSDGILLVMSMEDRDYDLAAYGEFGNYAFTDYGKDVIADAFLDDFRNNDWFTGFNDYISACGSLMEQGRAGTPVDYVTSYYEDYDYEPSEPSRLETAENAAVPGILVGLLGGLIRGGSMKKKMKSAVAATEASDYVVDHGVDLMVQEDRFTHATVIRQHIEHDSGNRGGSSHSGGTSVNSAGFSHHSGKF